MDFGSLVRLVIRDDLDTAPTECAAGNDFDGRIGARISSIFVILVGSTLGAIFPVYARRRIKNRYMDYGFFFAKYFGSGVIVATAFIHLLAPATEALGDPCLTGVITEYPWPMGICLMMVFVLFFVELMTVRYANFGHSHDHDHEHGHDDHSHTNGKELQAAKKANGRERKPAQAGAISEPTGLQDDDVTETEEMKRTRAEDCQSADCADSSPTHVRGKDHLGHGREHQSNDGLSADWQHRHETTESYAAQMTAIFILEFGIIFHSIFIGLTLAVAGEEFISLYIVLIFHQTFEGLGLGTRLAAISWGPSKRWTPYVLAGAYGLSTPIAIAIGLIVRNSYPPGSATTLIVNGVFDALSAGILIYTGLVELMAHEFMFSPTMRKAPIRTVLTAFLFMCLGAGLMALLGKWA